jgi:hypothetical protein
MGHPTPPAKDKIPGKEGKNDGKATCVFVVGQVVGE